MKKSGGVAIVLVLLIILFSGYVIYYNSNTTGHIITPQDDPRIEQVIESAGNWLLTPAGSDNFPNVTIDEPIVVHYEDKEPMYWIVPFLNENRMIVGNVITDDPGFTIPNSFTKYGEPLETIFSISKEDALEEMIANNVQYNPAQITEPIIVGTNTGTVWRSEVVINGQVYDILDIYVFIRE